MVPAPRSMPAARGQMRQALPSKPGTMGFQGGDSGPRLGSSEHEKISMLCLESSTPHATDGRGVLVQAQGGTPEISVIFCIPNEKHLSTE